MLAEQPRITVIGTSASGKTTFARELAAILGRRHVELDELYWGPDWTPRADFRQRTESALAAETWICDGNYSKVRDVVWRRATAVVWLRYPFHLVFRRAMSRTLRRILTREPVCAGNRESFRGAFLDPEGIPFWVIRTHRKRTREYPRMFREPRYQHLKVVELRSSAATAELLDDLRGASRE